MEFQALKNIISERKNSLVGDENRRQCRKIIRELKAQREKKIEEKKNDLSFSRYT